MCVIVVGFFVLLFRREGFFSVLEPRDRLRGLGGEVGSACEEFEDSGGGILG